MPFIIFKMVTRVDDVPDDDVFANQEDDYDFDVPPMPKSQIIRRKIPNLSPKRARLEEDLNICNNINPSILKCKFIADHQWDCIVTPLPNTAFYNSSHAFKKSYNYPDSGIHLTIVFPKDYPN